MLKTLVVGRSVIFVLQSDCLLLTLFQQLRTTRGMLSAMPTPQYYHWTGSHQSFHGIPANLSPDWPTPSRQLALARGYSSFVCKPWYNRQV